MKKNFLGLFLFFLLLPSPIFSQTSSLSATIMPTPIDYSLPFPGILPDHPLYFLKTWRDKILLFFTREPTKKSQTNLLLADKHLVMGRLLWEKEKFSLALSTFKKGETYLLQAVLDLKEAKEKGTLPVGMREKLELAAKKHEEVFNSLSFSLVERERENFLAVLALNNQAKEQISFLK